MKKLSFKSKGFFLASLLAVFFALAISILSACFNVGVGEYAAHRTWSDMYPFCFSLLFFVTIIFFMNKRLIDQDARISDIFKSNLLLFIFNHIIFTVGLLIFIFFDRQLYSFDISTYEKASFFEALILNCFLLGASAVALLCAVAYNFIKKYTILFDRQDERLKPYPYFLFSVCILSVNSMLGEFIRTFILYLGGPRRLNLLYGWPYLTPIICAVILIIANVKMPKAQKRNYILFNTVFLAIALISVTCVYGTLSATFMMAEEINPNLIADSVNAINIIWCAFLLEYTLLLILAIILSLLIIIFKKRLRHKVRTVNGAKTEDDYGVPTN